MERNYANLISIPRDLYHKKKKINSLYGTYGIETLAGTVSEITGLEINRHAVVDMYAFVELVNVLGGIDVELEEPLVDPTYRVRDENGNWTTLFYPAGIHHVNGIEALRIARARHFTPVFSRDYRQQKILMAIKDKLGEIGVADIGKLGSIIRIGFRYTKTDISLKEAYTLYRTMGKIEKIRNISLGTGNVLYETYSNLLHHGLTASDVDEDFDKGAWIVVPIDNDWELVRKFIKEKTDE